MRRGNASKGRHLTSKHPRFPLSCYPSCISLKQLNPTLRIANSAASDGLRQSRRSRWHGDASVGRCTKLERLERVRDRYPKGQDTLLQGGLGSEASRARPRRGHAHTPSLFQLGRATSICPMHGVRTPKISHFPVWTSGPGPIRIPLVKPTTGVIREPCRRSSSPAKPVCKSTSQTRQIKLYLYPAWGITPLRKI